jgi:hypothetical protein
MFSSTPTQTRGQIFENERQRRLVNRIEAMKTVTPQVVIDVHKQIDEESKADPEQTVFHIYLAQILEESKWYSKGVFEKACGNTKKVPYYTELAIFANAVLDDSTGKDFTVRVEGNGQRVCVDFTNVASLAETRIAETAEAAKQAESIQTE